jgi:iron complex outermembrane receptor protein
MAKSVNRSGALLRNQMFAASSLFALAAAGGAHAQTAPAVPAANEIVVTGTQIRGVAAVGSPITVVNRNEIEQSGLVNTGDILHDLPQVSSLGAGVVYNGANQTANLDTSRDDAVNIRGLQPQATLVLLDGRRTPNGGSTGQLYDPSSIPTLALSGIDLLTGGASATYGSDAVAGVINLTLRKNFDGLEVEGTYGDGIGYRTEKLGGIFGKKWDGGSVMIAVETSNGTQLVAAQRPNLYNCSPNGLNNCSTAYPTYGNVVFSNSPAYFSTPVTANGTGITQSQLTPGAATFNQAQDGAILPKSNRNSLVWNIQQDATSNIHLWSEGYLTSHNNKFNQGMLSISGTAVGAANPGFIPLTGSQTSEKAYTSLDGYVGPLIRTGLEQAYQVAGGADVILPHDWGFNIYGEHNYNHEYVTTQALNTTTTPLALACTTPGLCYDPFGPNAVNTSALPQIIGSQYPSYWQTEDVVNGKFDGPVFALPGGEVKLAVGGEIQNNSLHVVSLNNTASPTTSIVHVAGIFTAPRTISSVFAEAIIPIIGDNNRLPFVESFVIDAAGRFDHYSDVGSTSNPKISFNWKPVSDLSIHGQYGTSFRAPTLCDTNPTCTGSILTSTAYTGYDAIIPVGGNASVRPETSSTYDFGASYKPSQIPGLTATLDYYSIDYEGVIATPGTGLTPAQFNSATYAQIVNKSPTSAYISSLQSQTWYVAPAGAFSLAPGATVGSNGLPIAVIIGERYNSGAILTHGIDFATDYKWSNGLGAWSAGISGTYLIDFNYSAFKGLPFVQEANKINYPTNWRFRAKGSWSADNLTVVGYVNYTGAYENNSGVNLVTQNLITPNSAVNTVPVNSTVKPFVTVDLTLLYKVPEMHAFSGVTNNTTVSVTFLNLFNAAPPYAQTSATQEYDAQAASPLGRVINLTLKKAF